MSQPTEPGPRPQHGTDCPPADPPGAYNVATWNMQGARHSDENKWNTVVGQLKNACPVIALQEAGTVPASASHVADHAFGRWTVREYTWGGTRTRPGPSIYWLETDPLGHRVNLALVTARAADQVHLAPGPYRPAPGARFGSDVYFTLHGSAGDRGGDVPTLLHNVNLAAGGGAWYALGDFNCEPYERNLGFQVCPPDGPTHPATRPTRKLDYMVRGSAPAVVGGVLTNVHMSDHLPVMFTL